MCAFECVPLVAVHEVVAVSEDRLPSQIWRSDSGADRQTRVGIPRTTSSTISKGAPGAVRVSSTGRLSRKPDKRVNEVVRAKHYLASPTVRQVLIQKQKRPAGCGTWSAY